MSVLVGFVEKYESRAVRTHLLLTTPRYQPLCGTHVDTNALTVFPADPTEVDCKRCRHLMGSVPPPADDDSTGAN